uniref:Uncharacterized protein n=1 Tax=Gopherus agassizii TaxID=38772 RepID=A0A452I540_9SAUR
MLPKYQLHMPIGLKPMDTVDAASRATAMLIILSCAPAPLQLQASNSISLNLQSCQCMTEVTDQVENFCLSIFTYPSWEGQGGAA